MKDDHQKEKNSLLDSLSKKDVLLEELTLAQNNLKQALQSASDEVTQLHKELEQRVQNNFEIQVLFFTDPISPNSILNFKLFTKEKFGGFETSR